MSLNQELKDFMAGWATTAKIGSMYDDAAYKRQRAQYLAKQGTLLDQRIKDMQDPEMRKAAMDSRAAQIRAHNANAGLTEERTRQLSDPENIRIDREAKQSQTRNRNSLSDTMDFNRARIGGADADSVGEAAPIGGGYPSSPITTPGAPGAPSGPASGFDPSTLTPDKMSAIPPPGDDDGDEGGRTAMADNDGDELGYEPTQFAAKGGKIRSAVPCYDEGGLHEGDDDEDDPSSDRAMDAYGQAELSGEADGGVGGVPAPQAPAQEAPPAQNFSLQAAHDAAIAGLRQSAREHGILQDQPAKRSAVRPMKDEAAFQAYLRGNGAAGPAMYQEIVKTIDPKGELPEARRNMAALSLTWQYFHQKGDAAAATQVAKQLIQQDRMNATHYASLSLAAMGHDHFKEAAEFATKAYASIPNGKEVKFEADDNGNVTAVAMDENGQPVKKQVMKPEDLRKAVMGAYNFDQVMADAAGMRGAEQSAAGGKGKGAIGEKPRALRERDAANSAVDTAVTTSVGKGDRAEAVGDPVELKHLASKIYSANDITPEAATHVVGQLVGAGTPKVSIRRQEDGSAVAFDEARGVEVKLPKDVFRQIAAMRGASESKRMGEVDKGAKGLADRIDPTIDDVEGEKAFLNTPERKQGRRALKNPGREAVRRQREDRPDDKPEPERARAMATNEEE